MRIGASGRCPRTVRRGAPTAARCCSRPSTTGYPRAAAVRLLQRLLRHLVLSAVDCDGRVQRRTGPIPGRRDLAPGDRRGDARRARPLAAARRPAAGPVSPRAPAGAARRWLRPPQAARLARGRTGRVCDRRAEQRAAGQRVRRLLGRARVLSRATRDTIRLYGETRYAAKKWSHRRRIIMKAEVIWLSGPGDQEQSPLRGHEPRLHPGDGLRDLLWPGRHGEPD
jgi:hypothetical protein